MVGEVDATDYVRDIIAKIPTQLSGISLDGVQFDTCDTLYATVNKLVSDSLGNDYEITDFLQNQWVKVKPLNGAPPFADTVLNLSPITYLHGTPSSVNNEYLLIQSRQKKKTPFIWLLESYEDELPGGDSAIELIFSLRLFFMEGSIDDKSNDDQHTLYIKPMRRLAQLFIDVVENDFAYKRPTNTRIKPRARFGVEVSNKGNTKHILDDALSGVEMSITLELLDAGLCNKYC